MAYSSIAGTIEAIGTAIEKAVPTTWTDRGFQVAKLSVGMDLEDWIRDASARRLRETVIRVTSLPTIGSSLCYLTGELAVEIAYPCSIPEDVRSAMMFDDTVTIIRSVISDPANWGGAENVWSNTSGQVEQCIDGTGRPLLYVASIPFTVTVS